MDAIYALTLTFKYARMRKCATLNCCWTFTIWWRWLNAYPTSECIFKHFKFPKRNITLPFCKNTEMKYKKFTNDMALNKNGDIHHRSLSPEKVFKTNEKHVEDHWIYYVSPEASLVEWRKCRTGIHYNVTMLDKLKWSIHFVSSTVGSTRTVCCPQCQQT